MLRGIAIAALASLAASSGAHAQVGAERFAATARGDLRIAGNTLGLSKASGVNGPGTNGSIGTFLSADSTLVDGAPLPGWPGGPPGTTAQWALNSSAAPLDLPAGAAVLHAELVWGGSWQYGGEDVTAFLDDAVTLAFQDGAAAAAVPEAESAATLSQSACAGYQVRYYARSADVTAFVAAKGAGRYTVLGVPGTQQHTVNTLNAAGWCLIVAYRDDAEPLRRLAIRVGAAFVEDCAEEEQLFAGFTTPGAGAVGARVVAAALEGDADAFGDQLFISDGGGVFHALSSPNNPEFNFFASQINDSDGNLEPSGTAGWLNHDAFIGVNQSGARQGWDATGAAASEAAGQLDHGQSSLRVRAATSADAFVLVGLGLAVDTQAPAGVAAHPGEPARVVLEAPAPNPLAAETRVRYALPRTAAMQLRVVDAAGRLTHTLHRGAWRGGEGTAVWDARDDRGRTVPPGVYFLLLEAEGTRRVERVTVVR